MAKAKLIKGLDAQAPAGINARIAVKARLEEMYGWSDCVDYSYSVHDLHNLRIAAKRLRYTLEIFAEVLPQECAPLLKEIEQIQDELGALHDSDVMIALLRLCLAGQDGGPGYEYALIQASRLRTKSDFLLNPEMVTYLVDPAVAPSAEERSGLEHLLRDMQLRREQQYSAFRQHWYQLQARDFRRELIGLLDS